MFQAISVFTPRFIGPHMHAVDASFDGYSVVAHKILVILYSVMPKHAGTNVAKMMMQYCGNKFLAGNTNIEA